MTHTKKHQIRIALSSEELTLDNAVSVVFVEFLINVYIRSGQLDASQFGDGGGVALYLRLIEPFVRPILQYTNFAGFLVNRVDASGAAYFQAVVLAEMTLVDLKE